MARFNVSKFDNLILNMGFPVYLGQAFFGRFKTNLFPVMKTVDNWFEVSMFIAGKRERCTASFKSGKKVVLDKNSMGKFWTFVALDNMPRGFIDKYNIHLEGNYCVAKVNKIELRIPLLAAIQTLFEFDRSHHDVANIKNKVVIDIGAYVCDTSLFYAIAGKAKKIYAYEPVPYLYKVAKENIKLNDRKRKIQLFNAGVAGKNGFVEIDSDFSNFTQFSNKTENSKSKKTSKVPLISLDEVVKKHKISNAFIKIDCEGCEYEIFENASSKAIHAFDIIHIEYHYGYADLVKRLEREGYKIRRTKARYNFKGFGVEPMLNGEIIATKMNQ